MPLEYVSLANISLEVRAKSEIVQLYLRVASSF